MVAQDRGWLEKIQKLIDSGLTAEAAIQQTQTDIRFQIMQLNDPHMRERLWDFQDLTNRLLKHLMGSVSQGNLVENHGVILLARAMGPAELLDYQKYDIRGLILEEGVQTAHVSIVARALGIPVISRVQNVLSQVEFGDTVIMDATKGEIVLRPHEQAIHTFEGKMHRWRKRREKVEALGTLPARTLDGIDISLKLNAGIVSDLKKLEGASIDGVGLYRTEIPFMMSSSYLDVAAPGKALPRHFLRRREAIRWCFGPWILEAIRFFRTFNHPIKKILCWGGDLFAWGWTGLFCCAIRSERF